MNAYGFNSQGKTKCIQQSIIWKKWHMGDGMKTLVKRNFKSTSPPPFKQPVIPLHQGIRLVKSDLLGICDRKFISVVLNLPGFLEQCYASFSTNVFS